MHGLAYESTGPAISAGTVRAVSVGTVVFSNSNGVSFGMSGSSQITMSAAAGGAGTGPSLSAGTQSVNSGTVVFSDLNGVLWSLSSSSPRMAAQYQYVAAAGASTAGNTQGNTGTFSNSTFVFEGSNYLTASQITGPNGITVRFSGTTPGMSDVSAGGSNFTTGRLSFVDRNGIVFGISGSTLTADPGLVDAAGVSSFGNTAGDTGTKTGNMVFVASGNLTASQSTAAGVHTINFSAVAGAPGQLIGMSAGTQSGSSGTVLFSNSNSVTFGMSTGAASVHTLTASAAGGGGGTRMSFWQHPNVWASNSRMSSATLYVQPFYIGESIDATRINILASASAAFGKAFDVTMSFGIYTMSGSTASRASSGSFPLTAANTDAPNFTGLRWRSGSGMGTWSIEPGEYLMAFLASHDAAAGGNSSLSLYGQPRMSVVGGYTGTGNIADFWGQGLFSASTTALPASIHISDVDRTGANINNQPGFILHGTF